MRPEREIARPEASDSAGNARPEARLPAPGENDAGWRKLAPRVLAIHVVRLAGALAPIAFALLIGGGSLNRTVAISLAFICGGAALRAAGDAVAWATTRYRVGEELVELRSGLLRRSELSVPRDRVRTVNLTAKPLQRAFRLTTVEIGTGTHEQGRLKLDAVPSAEAGRLREALLRRAAVAGSVAPVGSAPASLDAGAPASLDAGAPAPAGSAAGSLGAAAPAAPGLPDEPVLARLRWGWLPYHLLSPWTLALPIVAVGALLNVLNQLGVEGSVGRVASHAAVDGVHRIDDERWWIVSLVALALVSVIVVAGAVGAALQFAESWWDYRLTREANGTLHLRRGLLTSRSVTIEQRRLRGAALTEPLLQRTIGGAAVHAVVSGLRRSGDDRKRADTLLPNVPRAEADALLADVLEEPGLPDRLRTLEPHPRPAHRRRLTRALAGAALPVVVLVLAGPLLGWLPSWLWPVAAVVALPLGLLFGRSAYHALGHRLAGGYLVTRHGVLPRRTVALRRDGVIGWTVRRSFFQRRAGLVTLTATTAAGSGGYAVIDVSEADGLAFAEEAVPDLLGPFLARAGE